MPERSSNGVRVFSVDRRRIEDAVHRWISDLRARRPEIERVVWFGSFAHGTPAPGSDVDICLVLTGSDRSFRDRMADYLPDGIPVDVEVFPYTRAELDQLAREQPEWYEEIMRGRDVA